MRRSEPFRALLEEARAAERKAAPAPAPPPLTLAQRLDQMVLAGGTPARGTPIPPVERLLAPSRSASTDELLEALDASPAERTRRLPAGGTVDAALQDTLAELEATVEVPAQRRLRVRRESTVSSAAMPRPPVAVPEPVALKDVPRPPPLPAAKPKARPEATCAPAPVLSEGAPVPRMVQFLGDENTLPGVSPGPRCSSSSSGKVVQLSDQYRLQLEFEDTPARPLPRVSFVPPPPLPAAAKKAAKAAASAELRELEIIDDLDDVAHALGLDGVGDVSIPSLEGMPLLSRPDDELDLPDLSGEAEALEDEDLFASPGAARGAADEVRRALAEEARRSAEGAEGMDDFAGDLAEEIREHTVETVFPERRSSRDSGATRPALSAGKAVTPVIVKIPSRPKVSVEARERARRLYLEAVEKLGKGDRTAAVLHLKLAIDYDDGIPLYRDLLSQLEGTPKPGRPPEGPTLTVLGPQGQRSEARDHWRSARPR